MKPINVFTCLCIWVTCAFALALPGPAVDPGPDSEGVSKVQSRMDMIKELYAWSGFVYAIWVNTHHAFLLYSFSFCVLMNFATWTRFVGLPLDEQNDTRFQQDA